MVPDRARVVLESGNLEQARAHRQGDRDAGGLAGAEPHDCIGDGADGIGSAEISAVRYADNLGRECGIERDGRSQILDAYLGVTHHLLNPHCGLGHDGKAQISALHRRDHRLQNRRISFPFAQPLLHAVYDAIQSRDAQLTEFDATLGVVRYVHFLLSTLTLLSFANTRPLQSLAETRPQGLMG